ncbi:MAG: non-canonical purine NTP pyrophosphatase [Euryarchaeota archaeon]|jgi:XTP/dITP diphosphohydrolase|nr:non-canonical purine NTP pyrophosphatase [Euryarchaeota archaeon]MBT7460268.1 non-canonical purine NTP pyrophosphatase [Euryarchaeota archaeon]
MGRKIWFLTGNLGKVAEAREHLAPLGYEVNQLIVPEDNIVEPQTDSLTEVAMAKIEQAKSHLPGGSNSKDMLMIEDAGLFIDALSGFPGVYSAYVHNTIGCGGIIKLLSHLTSEDSVRLATLRSAEFRAVAVLWDDGKTFVGNGSCPGYISQSVVEGNGFGYDPLFVPYDLDSVGDSLAAGEYGATSTHGSPFGGVESSVKKKFSHRSRALNDLFNQLPSA